ncbi:MAG: hypothetical protein IID32_03545 [Planctomycetes bacterium]|nr:hypothetical protein [Planctomycetota bacterium]
MKNKPLKIIGSILKGLLKGTDSLILSGAITTVVEETKKSIKGTVSPSEGSHLLIRLIPVVLLVGAGLGWWSIQDLKEIVKAILPFLGS